MIVIPWYPVLSLHQCCLSWGYDWLYAMIPRSSVTITMFKNLHGKENKSKKSLILSGWKILHCQKPVHIVSSETCVSVSSLQRSYRRHSRDQFTVFSPTIWTNFWEYIYIFVFIYIAIFYLFIYFIVTLDTLLI